MKVKGGTMPPRPSTAAHAGDAAPYLAPKHHDCAAPGAGYHSSGRPRCFTELRVAPAVVGMTDASANRIISLVGILTAVAFACGAVLGAWLARWAGAL